jgi:hypothetical protein
MFDPSRTAKQLDLLRRNGRISRVTNDVGRTLLWSCRANGRDEAQVSYDRIAKLARVARSVISPAIKELRKLGILTWKKTRIRVVWALGIANRQGRNVYRFVTLAPKPPAIPESNQQPANKVQVSKKGSQMLDEALARLGSAIFEVRPAPD